MGWIPAGGYDLAAALTGALALKSLNGAGPRYPKGEGKRLSLSASMTRGTPMATSSLALYVKSYTSSTFNVFFRLSACGLSLGRAASAHRADEAVAFEQVATARVLPHQPPVPSSR